MSIDDTKKQDHTAPSTGITCSTNVLINQAWVADFVSISQCLLWQSYFKQKISYLSRATQESNSILSSFETARRRIKWLTPDSVNGPFYWVRTLFQKQISRTFPGLLQDSDWFFKGSKIHINPYTPKISMLILLTAFHTLHIFL